MEINKKYLFWVILLVCIFSFLNRNNYRNVDNIEPELSSAPLLGKIDNAYPLKVISRGLTFNLTPVYDCKIYGLVVVKMSSSLMRAVSCKDLLGKDLLEKNKCFLIIWGKNVGNKVYKNKAVSFSEDGVNLKADVGFDFKEAAYLSLIPKDDSVWSMLKSLSPGDQVALNGKLVNINANLYGRPFQYNTGLPGQKELLCVMYVEDLKILKKANLFFNYLFWVSLFGLVVLFVVHLSTPFTGLE